MMIITAFAIADFTNFSTIGAAALFVYLSIAIASFALFPLIKSITILTFLALILA